MTPCPNPGKRRYSSWSEAAAEVGQLSTLRPYQCECGAWHLGRQLIEEMPPSHMMSTIGARMLTWSWPGHASGSTGQNDGTIRKERVISKLVVDCKQHGAAVSNDPCELEDGDLREVFARRGFQVKWR